jgi:predicted nucleic acid-binding protein
VNGFLLDTNIVSELIRSRPEPKLSRWIASTDENLLYLSVLTMGEIRKGIVQLGKTARQIELQTWVDRDLRSRFSDRILPIDEAIADRWGWISGQAMVSRVRLPVIDGLLAATALHYNLTFVTRNTRDVLATGAVLFNPWQS